MNGLNIIALFSNAKWVTERGRWEDTHHERERPFPWHHSDQSREQHLEDKTQAVRGQQYQQVCKKGTHEIKREESLDIFEISL